MTNTQSPDLISFTGRKLSELLLSILKVKTSAFFINDTIAQCLGFKGHSDYINRAIHEPHAWAAKIISPEFAGVVLQRIMVKYSIDEQLKKAFMKHYKKEAKLEKAMLKTIDSFAQDNAIYIETKRLYEEAVRYSSGDEYPEEKAASYLATKIQEVFDAVYLVVPVRFTLGSWISACLNLHNKKKKTYDPITLLNIESELKALLGGENKNSANGVYSCINELLETTKDVKIPKEWVDVSDGSFDDMTNIQLYVSHVFLMTRDARIFASMLHSLLSKTAAA